MSHYNTIECEYRDAETLIASLAYMHYSTGIKLSPSDIEYHKDGSNLVGYMNDERAQIANVIIRRRFVGGASNDLGFVRNANGTYSAIISDYDSEYYNKTWQGLLKQRYAAEAAKKAMRARKIRFTESQIDGKIVLEANA